MTNPLADLFDRVADRYDEKVPFFKTLGRQLAAFAELAPDATVLDVGVGRGAVAIGCLERLDTGTVTAIDVSPQMIEQVNALGLPRLNAQVMDVNALDLPDASFDAVTSGFTLHFLPDKIGALAEIRRVLQPGGSVCFSTPGDNPAAGSWPAAYGEIYGTFMTRLPDGDNGGFAAPDQSWAEVAQAAGLTLTAEAPQMIDLPLPGPDAYWDWLMSHGARWLYDALPEADAAEFKAAVLDSFVQQHPTKGHNLLLGPRFYQMTKAHG